MKLVSISLRNLRIRLVATILTMASIVVATALYAAILVMAEQTDARYRGSIGGYQAVVGPKDCSQLELVLNTIFNVGEAPGLFPLQVCMDLRAGSGVSRRGQVRFAIPQARGDSVSRFNFPVIATLDEMFTKYEWQKAPLVFAQGKSFTFGWDDLMQFADELVAWENGRRAQEAGRPKRPALRPEWRQCVVGSRVARTLQLELGSVVTPVHGKMGEFGYHEHPEASCTVVGVLAPTNSPLDTTIFLPLSTHLLIDGHEEGVFVLEIPPGKNPDDVKKLPVKPGNIGLTAVVVDPKDHLGARVLRRDFGTRPDAQVAWPQDVVPKFLRQIGAAAAAGCHYRINFKREDFVERVREITAGKGVTVAYDGVGKESFAGSLDCLDFCGHLVNFGQASGSVPPFEVSRLAAKSSSLSRPIIFHYVREAAQREEMAANVFKALEEGWLKVNPARRFALGDAAESHRVIEAAGATIPLVLVP